MTPWAPADK
jgi:hypothetical protein